MNQPEHELNRILYELRSEHQGIEAPAFLEERLAQKARLNAGSKASPLWSLRRGWAWGLGFALVVIASTIAWRLSIRASLHPPQQIAAHPVKTEVMEQAATALQEAPQSQAQDRQRSARPRRAAVRHPQAEDSSGATTSFLALPESEGLPEPAQQSIVRARILTSSLAQYGLEVPASLQPQFVSAEFLVGEDGLPRAIRFVR